MSFMLRAPILYPLLVAFSLFYADPASATGNIKGNLDEKELNFIQNSIFPILVESNLCTSATGDCVRADYIICISTEFLACDIYGIVDMKVIKKILDAMLNSGLNVSRFVFWRSRYHKTGLLEKPLVEYINRVGG